MDRSELRSKVFGRFKNQKAFADAIKWSENKVSKLLNGDYVPDVDQASEISDVLDLNEKDFCVIFLNQKSPIGD